MSAGYGKFSVLLALSLVLVFFFFFLSYDSTDGGETECLVDHQSDSKSKIYFVDCNEGDFQHSKCLGFSTLTS